MGTKKAAESRLSGTQFVAAMEHSPIGTALVGLDGRWLWTNIALRKIFGYSKDALEQIAFQTITHPDDLDADLELVGKLIAGDISAYQMEKRYLRRDGDIVWCLLTVSLVRDKAGAPDYFISKIQDISERKADEIKWAELNERLTLATRAGGVGVWEWNILTNQLIWDARMHELYGVPSSVEPNYEIFLERVHERERERIDRELADAVANLQPYDTEFAIVGPDGEERQLRALGTVVREDGRPTRMIGTNWDVTEVRRLMRLAEASATSKSEFLATMSHELRTPLNSIIGFSEMLLTFVDDPALSLGPKAHHYVEMIRDSSATLLTVVNDVLDYSRIEAGGFELDPHAFDLVELTRGALEVVRHSAEDKNLRLSVDLPISRLPRLIGDSARLRQVLFNLLSNAIKFTREGEVRVIVETASEAVGETRQMRVRVRVQDSGIGIPPARRHRLFKRFSQADPSIAREFGGTGLGLAICERMISAMNGTIGIDSERVEGSEFWFEVVLPATELRMTALEGGGLAMRDPTKRAALRRRVLLAEDVAINQELVVGLLTREGHAVEVVADGVAAVQAVQKSAFDIVFMDVQMPAMDGLEATRRIRGLGGAYCSLPIVAVTANVLGDDVARYLEAGMTDHVGKPFKLAALSAAIDKWCPPVALNSAA